MQREIIRIDQDLCNGCGLCVTACHEGAIQMKDGKAVLVRDDYCDGLGNCLPACPTGAISFETREAAAYDVAAVKEWMAQLGNEDWQPLEDPAPQQPAPARTPNNFPFQLQLVAPNAAFFKGARLLLAADCAAYAHADFHRDFMDRHVTLIACPKLDEADYPAKLAEILRQNDIRSLSVVRMEVPCCGGLERIATKALRDSGKVIPWQIVTLSTRGQVLSD